MASADAMACSEMIRTEQEMFHLRREVVSDDFQGHSCEQCKHTTIRQERDPMSRTDPLFRIHTTPAEICGLAAAGCNFWIMIRNRLGSIARDDEINVAQSLEERERRWTDDQYKILAASSAGDEKDAYVHLDSVLEWANIFTPGESYYDTPVNPVRVDITDLSNGNIGVDVLVPRRSANTDGEGGWLRSDGTRATFRLLSLPHTVRRDHSPAPINLNPDSSTSMELYRHWLKRCECDSKCGIRDPPESMPSFILDVDKSSRVKLIQVPATMRDPYVALSYCWGSDKQRTMLKRRNRHDLLNSINLEDLDLTISDSVTVTRELGFRYLWIDALCIVQDDEQFKAQELKKMGDIYYNAALTIIASGAKDVTEGFLHRRTSTLDRFGVAPGYPQPVFKFHLGRAQTPVVLVPDKDYDEEPWYQRAWTMQEMIFSRRRLQFGLNQTTWVCHCFECGMEECDGWLADWYDTSSCGVHYYLPSVTEDDRFTAGRLLEVWFKLIRQCSSRQLRYSRDRLPAISAIARKASSILGNYICGLWTSHLSVCLSWYRGYGNLSGLKGYPSWSWASHEGETISSATTKYGCSCPNQDFVLLSHNVDLVTPGDPFGEASRAELHVRGVLLPIRGVISEHGYQLVKLADQMVNVSCTFDYRDVPGEQPDTRYALSLLVLVDLNHPTGAEGIIVLEEADNKYSRVGWFRSREIWSSTSSNEDEESDMTEDEESDMAEDEESDMAEDESIVEEGPLGHRLQQLGGAIREFVLI